MIIANLACLVLTLSAAADEPAILFQAAEDLARSNQKAEAMAKVEQAVAALTKAHQAGEEISWQGRNGLRFAARLAREDFLDYDKSLFFCDTLFELAETDYWRVPARLERALTYRAQGDFHRAQQEYDAIAAGDERQRSSALVPRAEMIYFEIGDEARGEALLVEALANSEVNGRERFNSLRKCAREALATGRLDQALEWYARLEKLPFEKAQERARYLCQAWYEMGQLEESRGRTAQAKAFYRNALELEDGEMRDRARARDALESIEYFE